MNDILGQFTNDFVTEFGVFDDDENITDGNGDTYWVNWKGNKYFALRCEVSPTEVLPGLNYHSPSIT